MSTFLELQTAVQDLVIDLPPKVQSAIPRLINDAIKSVQKKYNFFSMSGKKLFTTSNNVFLLGTIDNFKEYRDQGPYLFKQHSKGVRLTTGDVINVQVAINQTEPGTPKYITEDISAATNVYSFNVLPYPDTNSDWDNGNYQIVIPYYAYTASLVNSNDTNWFTNNMDDYIIDKAVGEAFGLDWDYDAMAVWLQRADEKFKEAKKADKTSRIASVNELAVFWQGGRQAHVRV